MPTRKAMARTDIMLIYRKTIKQKKLLIQLDKIEEEEKR
jgi:hypothetical protein